jgi:integrase
MPRKQGKSTLGAAAALFMLYADVAKSMVEASPALRDMTQIYQRELVDAASTLAMAGVPLRTIAAILGHRDIRMTTRYAHLAPEHLRDAMRALDTCRTRSTGMQE